VTKNSIPELSLSVMGSAGAISAELGFKSEKLQEVNAKT
jgi:hypothetical protein